MNYAEYQKIQKDPLFNPNRHIREIAIDSLVYDRVSSQVRNQGNAIRAIPGMVTSLENEGQKVPITIIPDCPRPGKNYLKDGTTRVLSKERMGAKKITASTFHADVIYNQESKDSGEWFFSQCFWNEQLPSTTNSDADIKGQIENMVTNGMFNAVCGGSFSFNLSDSQRKQWIRAATKRLRETYPSRSKEWLEKALVDRLASTVPNNLFSNYTREQDVGFFNRVNPFVAAGTALDKAGDTYLADNGEKHAYYRATTALHMNKEILSYSYHKKSKDPSLKVVVAISHADIIKASSNSLQSEIDKLVDAARNLNTAGGFFFATSPTKVVDYLVVYPQIVATDNFNKAKAVHAL